LNGGLELIKFGITSRSFGGLSTEETAQRMRDAGFECCELCFVQSDLGGWNYNGIGDLTGITPETVKAAADTYRKYGIEVVALGVFSNLLERDAEKKKDVIDYFIRYLDFAEAAGIPVIASECGFVPGDRGLHADSYEADFKSVKDALVVIGKEAEKRGIKIAIEGCVLDVVPTPKRLRDMAGQLKAEAGLTNIGALLDPANYIAAADEDDMFKYLSNLVYYFHGKDRFVNDTYGRNVGEGEINWCKFFKNHMDITPDIPVVFEYSNKDNCKEVLDRAKKYYNWALNS
jgi:Sugar phosphate isomerases/epimerases